MCESQCGQGFILIGEMCQFCQDIDDLFAHQLQGIAHDDDISVVTDITACSAEVDDALGFGTLQTIGIDMAHDIMADYLFARNGIFIINILCMRLQLRDLLIRDRKAELLLNLCQCDPQFPPGTEFFIL